MVATAKDKDRAAREAAILQACYWEPALFQRIVLGRELWSKQVEVCDSIAQYPWTVVPAGRAVGKSFLLAGIVLWWLYTRPNSKVIVTGPDLRQVITVLWAELRAALNSRKLRIPLPFEHMSDGFANTQILKVREGWEALGFAARSTEGFSGQHRPEQLIIVDEASGIPGYAWTAIDGSASKRYVICGNAIKYDCRFRELHDLAEAGSTNIHSVTISSLEHPHAQLDESPIGAICKATLDQQREIQGEASTWWRSNILGKFPGKESVRFLPAEWLDACADPAILQNEIWREIEEYTPWVGIDPAGGNGGDRSVIVVRTNKRLLEVFASEWHGINDNARHRLEPKVVELCERWGVPGARVIYDKGGIGGAASLGSYLANHGLDGAIGYLGGGRGNRVYGNRRTANAAVFRNRIDPNRRDHVPFYMGGVSEWVKLRQELGELREPIMELEEGEVKQFLEKKESMKLRLKRSPDVMDALLMTYTYLE